MADNEHDGGVDGTEPQRDPAAPVGGDSDVTPAYGSSGIPEPDAHPAADPAPDGRPTPPQGAQITTTSGISVFGEGRYRITHRLGRGGMAEVFAAQDMRLGRTVAVKVLRPDLAEDAVARMRFTREAHAVASLNHHAVVAVYDTGEEAHDGETVPYIVMELVEGHTVRELLQSEEPPPVDQALIITAGILEALAYSHRHGIVHRDIKPANVIITNTGAVKVMDFGIARALTGASSTMTQTGMVMGTPQYLSPEQALGKAVDHRSDLYATGCMLYELLTLRPPFTGDTPLSVVYQHVQDAPVPPSQANGRVPASLDPLVLRSLAKDPDDRFQSADEMRAHVQHTLRTMHQGTAMTEVLAPGVAGVAGATAPTMIVGGAEAMTTALGAVNGPSTTPAMGNPVPVNPGSARPPAYTDQYDDEHDERNSRRAIFAVIAVLVAIAAITIGVALAMRNTGNNNTPTTGTSSSVTDTTSPVDTPSQLPSITPSTTPSTTPSSASPSYSAPTTPTQSPSSTPTDTTSDTPSDSPSDTPSNSGAPSGSTTPTGSTTPGGGQAGGTGTPNPSNTAA